MTVESGWRERECVYRAKRESNELYRMLGTRVYNALANAGIDTLDELAAAEMAENVEHERDLLYGVPGARGPDGVLAVASEECRPLPLAEPAE